jgi:hypothetical protein
VTNSIDTQGMSGGPVIDLGDQKSAEAIAGTSAFFRLSGMTIEKVAKKRAHVAVRFFLVSNAISNVENNPQLYSRLLAQQFS